MAKTRIDKLLFERGLAPSRERAQAYILAGKVLVNDVPQTKCGALVSHEAILRVKGQDQPFVGRGGLKLLGALQHFEINPKGRICLDVGSSTGGFTDCLLQRGAAYVFAVDSGRHQLVESLKQNPQVLSLEQTNFRHAELSLLGTYVDFGVVDVSFISLDLILGPLFNLLTRGGEAVVLVKPQFEAGRGQIEKGGVVTDPKVRRSVIVHTKEQAESVGFVVKGEMDSPIQGKKRGNLEALLWLGKP